MIPLFKRTAPLRGRRHALPFAFAACAALAFANGTLHATPVPANLGNGLDRLVASQITLQESAYASGRRATYAANDGRVYPTEASAAMANLAISDDTGRFLVRIYGTNSATFAALRRSIKASISSCTPVATDRNYHGTGVMNAYVALEDVAALAQLPGVGSVILELKPFHSKVSHAKGGTDAAGVNGVAVPGEVLNKLGTDFDQGVTQHQVDQINKFYNPSAPVDYEGQGMQIGCISNSFASNTTNSFTIDVNNSDLPGSGNSYNSTPVFVLQDDTTPGGDDEGRAMCQIAYKMAPKAAIAFATADTGEVGFANNIRGLAGIAGYTNSGQTFAADTICDDVGYYDEPFFQDGIIGQGVNDASAAGVCYFSSAANDIGTNGYDSQLRFVSNDPTGSGALTAAGGNTALAGTNINLTNVPPALYAAGFHNFNPGGLTVAQLVNVAAANTVPTIFQYNEPYDQTATPQNDKLIYTQNGDYETQTDNAYTYTITPSLTANSLYELDEIASGGSSDDFDGAITITAPDGTIVVPRQDNAVNEVVRFRAPVTGTGYKVTVGHYSTTTGAFTLNLYSTTGYGGNVVTTQISVLVFDTAGNYLPNSSLTADERATDEPIQLGYTNPATGQKQVQYVFARANASTDPNAATEVRYLLPGNGRAGYGPATFFTYNTVTTGGHAMAETCNGCAAYSVFRPSLPETFTSPGPVTIYYDSNNNRLATPEVRLQPRFGTADAANVSTNMSYFTGDSGSDPDTNPNFSGTSAAGPHAAAIGALVLQAKGGRRSVTPAQMTSLLERSTAQHDLDPNFASGTAKVSTGGKVTISISSDGSGPNATVPTGTGGNDPNSFAIQYTGGSSVTSFVFNPGGTAATGGNVSGGNNGVTYSLSPTTVGGTATYFENSLPGVCFLPGTKAFTLGTGVTGATAGFSNLSSGTNQYYTMTITVPSGNMVGGSVLHFTVGRGLARAATTGSTFNTVTSATSGSAYYSADIFGGGVILPEGTVVKAGMTFSGTTADGGTFSGTISNRIGSGYASTDGYGFVNAQTAVNQTVQ